MGKELHEAYPNNVEFKNGLAISYAKLAQFSSNHLNDKAKARKYFQQAEALWVELVRDTPLVVLFQKFFGMVREELDGLDK